MSKLNIWESVNDDKNDMEAPLYAGTAELYSTSHSGCHALLARGPSLEKASPQNSDELDTDAADDVNQHSPSTMESLRYLGSMAGHKGWVTAIATSSENPDMILTASRGMFVSRFPLSCSGTQCEARNLAMEKL